MFFNKRNLFVLGALAGAAISIPSGRKSNKKLQIGDDKMKTVGMIGGTSWHSTIEYYRYLNEMVDQRIGPGINPPLLMYSLNVDLMRRGDWEEINKAFLDISRTLQDDGAEAIMICANTPHKVFDYVQPKIDIPILHIADATARAAQKSGLSKLGLMGTKPVTGEKFIPDRIKEVSGIEVVVPDDSGRRKMHVAIATKLTRGIFDDETRAMFIEEMNSLREQGAEGIILGCTELPMMFSDDDYDLPLFDTTKLHAEMAVEFILSDVNDR